MGVCGSKLSAILSDRCECLRGLNVATDRLSSPPRRTLAIDQVATYQEALEIDRKNEGSWKVSPKAPVSSPTSIGAFYPWTTPVPRGPGAIGSSAAAVNLDCDGLRAEVLAGAPPRGGQRSKFEIEQLVSSPGSLPRPMSSDEREAAIRTLHPTATFEMLAQVPRALLESSSEQAQELRRKLVRGATVVFVSAGYAGKRFIFERAATLGIKSVIIDHPDSWSKGLVAEGIAAKFLPVDMSQSSNEVYRQCEDLLRHLGEDGVTGTVDGVVTFVELAVPLAARLCETFGLPGPRPASVDAARDKHKTRAALKAAGLPTPRNLLIKKPEDLQQVKSAVGFPAVLKPISGAASLGVKKVESEEQLQSCYNEVVCDLQQLVVSSGALVRPDGSGAGVQASKVLDMSVLVEQYLDGQEVDIDIVMSDGRWQYAAITDNGPTLEPYFNETWGVCPSLLPKENQAGLKDLAVRCVQALGFSSGVFHVECKYTSTGPQLIEVNARMGGGPVHLTNSMTWGVDLAEEALFCALGIPSRPFVPEMPSRHIGYLLVNQPYTGRLRSTATLEEIRNKPDVLSIDILVKAGDLLIGPDTGLPSWVALLFVVKSSSEEAVQYIKELEASMDLSVDK
mmetsp:Transcript_6663/g.14559  ORF Transcript_6663/g.14559 Transcript_6663/m.14559 type:complete len:622 (-) Transcript_6663:138-2003(-)